MPDPAGHSRDRVRPGERLVTQLSREQRGWVTVALVAFFGVAFGGPALTRAGRKRRRVQRDIADRAHDLRKGAERLGHRTRRRVRRLGGGSIWR